MDMYEWIVSFIIIFMLHNLEEIITMERWFARTYPRVSEKIPSFAQKEINRASTITSAQFAVIVFVFSVAASFLIVLTVITQQYFWFLGLNFMFALNILTHPLQALFLRSYTPGLWTTLLLIIPYNLMLFYHISKAGILSMSTFLSSFVVMLLLIPVFLLSHKIGDKWS